MELNNANYRKATTADPPERRPPSRRFCSCTKRGHESLRHRDPGNDGVNGPVDRHALYGMALSVEA